MDESVRQKIKLIFIIVLVVALGLLAINQYFEWHYKMKFLQGPCDLCMELNPHLECRMGIPMTEINNKIINNFSLNPT